MKQKRDEVEDVYSSNRTQQKWRFLSMFERQTNCTATTDTVCKRYVSEDINCSARFLCNSLLAYKDRNAKFRSRKNREGRGGHTLALAIGE